MNAFSWLLKLDFIKEFAQADKDTYCYKCSEELMLTAKNNLNTEKVQIESQLKNLISVVFLELFHR